MNISKRTRNQVTSNLKKFQKLIKDADQEFNERNTVNLLRNFLSKCLGYNNYSEISAEQPIGKDYCDLIIKPENPKELQFLIEVKRIGETLKPNHVKQAKTYAANHEKIQYIILTNAKDWQLFKVELKNKVEHRLVMEFNLLELNQRNKKSMEKLFSLSKEAFLKSSMDHMSDKSLAMNTHNIGALLLNDVSLNSLQKNLKKLHGLKIDNEILRQKLQEDIIKQGIIEDLNNKPKYKNLQRTITRDLNKKRKVSLKKAVKEMPIHKKVS